MNALLLIALLAQVPDAGVEDTGFPTNHAVEVKDGYIRAPGDETYQVRGGAYLDDQAMFRVSSEMAYLRAENTELKKDPGISTGTWVGVVVGIVLGLAGGFYIGRTVK